MDAINIQPLPITVALDNKVTLDDCCTKRGFIPLTLADGSIHWQICYYCANAAETIISPQAIIASNDVFASWTMTGFKDGTPGSIRFDSHDGLLVMSLKLDCKDGLYYCPTDVFTTDQYPVRLHRCAISNHHNEPAPDIPPTPTIHHAQADAPHPLPCRPPRFAPITRAQQLESKVWLLCLGYPGVSQLNVLPQFATGLPPHFTYHPFRFMDFKEQARVRKQAAQRLVVRTTKRKRCFYINFGFMRASASDYSWPDKSKDRVIQSFDGYSSYLLIIDEASHFVWIFLTASKDPPLDIIRVFLTQHGHSEGGSVRTDQGGKLARCSALQDMLLWEFHYVFEPTGADSPSRNGAVEIYNDKFAVRTQTLL